MAYYGRYSQRQVPQEGWPNNEVPTLRRMRRKGGRNASESTSVISLQEIEAEGGWDELQHTRRIDKETGLPFFSSESSDCESESCHSEGSHSASGDKGSAPSSGGRSAPQPDQAPVKYQAKRLVIGALAKALYPEPDTPSHGNKRKHSNNEVSKEPTTTPDGAGFNARRKAPQCTGNTGGSSSSNQPWHGPPKPWALSPFDV